MSTAPKIKRFLSAQLQAFRLRSSVRRVQRQYKQLSLSETFERIYSSTAWRGDPGVDAPKSGTGSTGRYAQEYCELLERLLGVYRPGSVADLGCGNFAIGKSIAGIVSRYIGVDIAQSVVDWNTREHSNEHVRFVVADVTSDPLPTADAAIVRQVFQHLSNSEIQSALRNILATYPLVVITEHIYTGHHSVPNVDISHGPGTRVPMRSGVFVDRPPFNLRAKMAGDICYEPDEVLRTWVIERSPLECK